MKIQGKKLVYVILDCIVVNIAIFLSFIIKYDFGIPNQYIMWLPVTFIYATLISGISYYAFGLYTMLWVYASIEELIKVFLATTVATVLQISIGFFIKSDFPIAIYIIYWMITFLGVGGIRLSTRLIKKVRVLNNQLQNKKRVMIVGAGEASSLLIKEFKNNKRSIFEPIIAIDDDSSKHKTQINGVPVIGGRDKIIWAAKEMSIQEIIIAIPSISRNKTAELIQICNQTHCKLKVLPSVYGMVNGDICYQKIRDVTVEDLLQRDEINLSVNEISDYLNNQTILVTGGGGSIGSELCRQIAEYKPGKLIIFDIYENNAYDLQNELLQKYKNTLDILVLIGSIQDKNRLDYVFQTYHPEIVFHAAAHKHVPLMEENPQEAVKNNIYGTLNVVEFADVYGCKKFVLISTDKAVNPTSIMGATKRAAELIVQNKNKQSKTMYSAVRFGNVLGSSGSVIPLFKKQIVYGGPITITHPEITRYFMTIPEAASLVIQSGAMMEGGEIFVLDMGEPVNITDLANSLITLSGLKPNIDIEIEYVGLRPGEKLHEELLMNKEEVNITKNNKIFVEKVSNYDFSSFIQILEEGKQTMIDDVESATNFMKELVPTYQGTRNN